MEYDYGYYQHNALPYQLNHSFIAPQSPSSLSPSSFNNPISSFGFISEGFVPEFDHFQCDNFLTPTDQKSYNSMMVNEGFDQYDPLYSSLHIPCSDNNSPFSPSPLQVNCGRPSFESSESVGRVLFDSQPLWNDSFLINGFDTGASLLHHYQIPHQLKPSSETILSDNDVIKTEQEPQRRRAMRSKKRSAKQMRENDTKTSPNNNSVADSLTWEILSQYFYMPIAQAARELNIGLTLFKKRCRELGVRRWPHRKLMSIQSLIKNVKEMEKDGVVENPAMSKGMVRNAINELEKQKKMMEVMPDIELETQTKRLRQACFKANYKKRRLMVMNNGGLENSSQNETSVSNIEHEHDGQDFEESDVLRSLLFDSISPADCSFLNDYM